MDDRESQTLVALGLTGYEASAYVALIRRGRASGAEVARIAGLPRQRIYDVLETLLARGLATALPGRPTRYVAAPPDDAIGRLLELRRAELARLEGDVADALARLAPEYTAGRGADDPLHFVEILREPSAIARRFDGLQAAAEREILVFTKAPYAVEPGANVEGLRLLERGIRARSVYERSVYDHPAHVEAVRRFVAAGEEARVVDELPLKLVLLDERVALFTLEDPVAGEPSLTIMVVVHPALARLLRIAFESVWHAGAPFA